MKTYLEPSEIELLENQAGNLRDRLLFGYCSIWVVESVKHSDCTIEDIDLAKGLVSIEHLKIRSHLFLPFLPYPDW